MATQTGRRTRQDLLGVYLNDHLAGPTVGMSLARRMVSSAEPGSERATVLNRAVAEVTQDRSALLQIMATLGIPVRRYKVFAASG